MYAPQPLIAGNWKMIGLAAALDEAKAVAAELGGTPARVAICPPATLIAQMAWALKGTAVLIGGQDCHAEASGRLHRRRGRRAVGGRGRAPGDPGPLRAPGRLWRDLDALVAAKTAAAHCEAGLEPIVCVGGTLDQRKRRRGAGGGDGTGEGLLARAELAGKAFSVAYEPVWAIGIGADADHARDRGGPHRAIRATLLELFGEAGEVVPILYGRLGEARERRRDSPRRRGGRRTGGRGVLEGCGLPGDHRGRSGS